MNARYPLPASEDVTALHELREEVEMLHAAIRQTQLAVLLVARSIEQLRGSDAETRTLLQGLRQAVQIPAGPGRLPSCCAACGSHLECHKAEAGDFLICPACGWSDFVAVDGDHAVPAPAITEKSVASAPARGWV